MSNSASSLEFDGKVVMITGSASGIGLATAIAFAQQGALLSLADLNGDGLQTAAESCQKISPQNALPCVSVGDLTVPENILAFKENTIRVYGRIDILINNAGTGTTDCISKVDLDAFEKTINTNIKLPYYLTSLCVPHLVETKGNVVNISSVAGMVKQNTSYLSYSMSKAALDLFTNQIAGELGPHGVRVNGINPGFVITAATSFMSEEQIERMANTSALKRNAEPEVIADAILFLASSKSSFTTGSNFVIDGGNLCT